MTLQHRHTSGIPINANFTSLKLKGGRKTINISSNNIGALVVDGDSRFNGDSYINGNLFVNGTNMANFGSTFIQFDSGNNGQIMVSDDNGLITLKDNFWKSNDNPQEITDPLDSIIYTPYSLGISISNPEEKFHVSVSSAGEGGIIGNIKLGNWVGGLNDGEIIHRSLKSESTSYGLKLDSNGQTNLNSKNRIDFNILDSQVATIDSSGNFGLGLTTPTELLHVNGNAIIEGNLTVNGTTTIIDSSVVEVEDANLLLARNNPSDTMDVGILGQYIDSGITKFTGIFRDASSIDKHWEIFQQSEVKPTSTIDIGATGYERATLRLDGLDVQSGITISQADAIIKHNAITIIGNEPQIFLDITGNMGIGVTNPNDTIDIIGGFSINSISVLTKDTLGVGVTESSLENLGTLVDLHVTGETILDGNTTINGFLNVLGGVTFNNSVDVSITQPFLKLATGNIADLLDTGVYSQYVEGGVTKFSGYFRDASDGGIFKFFTGITAEPGNQVELSSLDGDLADVHVRELDVFGRICITGHYDINNITVLTHDTLGIGITQSSLETVGNLLNLNIIGDLNVDLDTFYVDSVGNNVGIGTTDPNFLLDVSGNIGALSYNSQSGNNLILKQSSSQNISFQDSTDSELMVLTDAGNLGIGVTIPTVQFDISGSANIGTNLVVQGNLTIFGDSTIIDSETLTVEDPMIKLAKNNPSDALDTGIYSLYNDGTTRFAGYFRDVTDGVFKFFNGTTSEPTTTVDITNGDFDYALLQSKEIKLNQINYTTDSTNLTFNSGTTTAVLTTGGFLGIGPSLPSYPLHIVKTNTSNWSARFTNTADVFIGNDAGNGISINSGVDNTNTNLNVNVRNTTTNNVFTVRNDDKVGILTSNPDKTFHVNIGTTGDGGKLGNAFIGNWASAASHATLSHDNFSEVVSSYAVKQNSSGQTNVNSASGQELHLNINHSQVVTITSSENIGIGVTNPTDKLEVSGKSSMVATSGDALSLSNTSTLVNIANTNGSGILTNASTTSNYGLSIRESNTAIFQVNNDGTIGIGGVTAPSADLEVRDTLRVSNTNGDFIDIIASTDNITLNTNDLLSLGVSGTKILNIDTSNNIGIGTSTPQQDLHLEGTQYISTSLGIGITTQIEALHIVGDGKVTGNWTIGGNLIFDGVAVDGLAIQDPLIKLGSNNPGDEVDSGFYSLYLDTGTTKFAGLFRDADDSAIYKLFHELEVEPGVTVDTAGTGFAYADLRLENLTVNVGITTNTLNATEITVDSINIGGNDGEISFTDPLISLGSGNIADTFDIGLFGKYNTGTTKYTGFFRDASDDKWKLFNNLEVPPGDALIDIGATGYQHTTLVVDTLEADTEVIAPAFNSTSDIRVKHNINPIEIINSYDKINDLSLYSYNFNNDYSNDNHLNYGLIAQEVEQIIPEAIRTRPMSFGNRYIEDFKSINQNTIITHLIGSMQYQNKLIKTLMAKLIKLENKIDYIL
jgi:hypothetical protein